MRRSAFGAGPSRKLREPPCASVSSTVASSPCCVQPLGTAPSSVLSKSSHSNQFRPAQPDGAAPAPPFAPPARATALPALPPRPASLVALPPALTVLPALPPRLDVSLPPFALPPARTRPAAPLAAATAVVPPPPSVAPPTPPVPPPESALVTESLEHETTPSTAQLKGAKLSRIRAIWRVGRFMHPMSPERSKTVQVGTSDVRSYRHGRAASVKTSALRECRRFSPAAIFCGLQVGGRRSLAGTPPEWPDWITGAPRGARPRAGEAASRGRATGTADLARACELAGSARRRLAVDRSDLFRKHRPRREALRAASAGSRTTAAHRRAARLAQPSRPPRLTFTARCGQPDCRRHRPRRLFRQEQAALHRSRVVGRDARWTCHDPLRSVAALESPRFERWQRDALGRLRDRRLELAAVSFRRHRVFRWFFRDRAPFGNHRRGHAADRCLRSCLVHEQAAHEPRGSSARLH